MNIPRMIVEQILETLYNVPQVGEVFDQQHSDTHMQMSLLVKELLDTVEE